MKVKEGYEKYWYNKIGELRGLWESVGYKREYDEGRYVLEKGDESMELCLDEMRCKGKEKGNEEGGEE